MLYAAYPGRGCRITFKDHESIGQHAPQIRSAIAAIEPYLKNLDRRTADENISVPNATFVRVGYQKYICIGVSGTSSCAHLAFLDTKEGHITGNIPYDALVSLSSGTHFFDLQDKIKDFGVREFERTLTAPLHEQMADYFNR